MSSTGAWSSSLPFTHRSGAEGLSMQPLVQERKLRRDFEKLLEAVHAHRAAARLEELDRPEDRDARALGERGLHPLRLEAVVHVAAVEDRALERFASVCASFAAQ